MEPTAIATIEFSSTRAGGVIGKSARTVNKSCDRPDGHPDKLPHTRTGDNDKRIIKLLDLARWIVKKGEKDSAGRLAAVLESEENVGIHELRAYLAAEGVALDLFPVALEILFLIGFPDGESGRIAPNYDGKLYDVRIVAGSHDASALVGRGVHPVFVAIDLSAGPAAGLELLYWLRRRPGLEQVELFAVIPMDGLAAELPPKTKSIQRPDDPEVPILDAFTPKEPTEADAAPE